ncbi:hypothetical protein [Nostoc sp.]|uniref:hypothetical protein n=1 Tax=Nostoc sp. TaxID=1180 RepID=UPI002FFBCAF3
MIEKIIELKNSSDERIKANAERIKQEIEVIKQNAAKESTETMRIAKEYALTEEEKRNKAFLEERRARDQANAEMMDLWKQAKQELADAEERLKQGIATEHDKMILKIAEESQDAGRKIETVRTEAQAAAKTAGSAENVAKAAKVESAASVVKTAENAKDILNLGGAVDGVRNLANGIGEKVDGFGRAIAKVEKSVGNAIVSGAKAVGISEQALAATGRLTGRVLEIFNVVSNLAALAA